MQSNHKKIQQQTALPFIFDYSRPHDLEDHTTIGLEEFQRSSTIPETQETAAFNGGAPYPDSRVKTTRLPS